MTARLYDEVELVGLPKPSTSTNPDTTELPMVMTTQQEIPSELGEHPHLIPAESILDPGEEPPDP